MEQEAGVCVYVHAHTCSYTYTYTAACEYIHMSRCSVLFKVREMLIKIILEILFLTHEIGKNLELFLGKAVGNKTLSYIKIRNAKMIQPQRRGI